MPNFVQNLIVLLIVAAAAVYLLNGLRRTFAGKKADCGCGKGSCAKMAQIPVKAERRD